MKNAKIKGINYNILAEEPLKGKASEMQKNYVSLLLLKRLNGVKEYTAMRTVTGEIEIL